MIISPNTYHSWQMVPTPPILWRPPFSNFVQHPFLVASTLHPHCSFLCVFFLVQWVIISHLMRQLMILWIYICQTLVPCTRTFVCVSCNKPSIWYRQFEQLTWYLIYDLISNTHPHTHTHTHTHTRTHTHKDTMHTQGPCVLNRLTHPYKYILTPSVTTDIQNFLSTMSFLFKNYSFAEVTHLLIRCNKTMFFL